MSYDLSEYAVPAICGVCGLHILLFWIVYPISSYVCNRQKCCYNINHIRIKHYIDILQNLKNEYCSRKNRQVLVLILLISLVLCAALMKSSREIYQSFISYEINHELDFMSGVDYGGDFSLSWNGIPLFIVFVIFCILLLITVYGINKTSHKIRLINSTIAKIASLDNCVCNEDNININMPNLSIRKHSSDSRYYWTFGNRWLCDGNNHMVRANESSIIHNLPRFRIKHGEWQFSYDNNTNWVNTGVRVHITNMAHMDKMICLEINRLIQELNTDSSRNIWRAIFNSH